MLDNLLAVFVTFLASVLRKAHRLLPGTVTQAEELLQLAVLTITQGVHRVDHDGLNALATATPEDLIDNRDDVGKALAGACARCEHIMHALACRLDGLDLMAMQPYRVAKRIGFRFDAEDACALVVQDAVLDQLVDPSPRL